MTTTTTVSVSSFFGEPCLERMSPLPERAPVTEEQEAGALSGTNFVVEAHADAAPGAFSRVALTLSKHRVRVKRLLCTEERDGLHFSLTVDGEGAKVSRVVNELRRFEEFFSVSLCAARVAAEGRE